METQKINDDVTTIFFRAQTLWISTGAPSASVSTPSGSPLQFGDSIQDSETGNVYIVISSDPPDTSTPGVWVYSNVIMQDVATNYNLPTLLAALSILPPVARDRTPITLDFNTSRQPSESRDTEVNANIAFSADSSSDAQVNIETSLDDSTWTQIIKMSSSTMIPMTLTIPVGSYYRLTTTGTGASIDSVYELTK